MRLIVVIGYHAESRASKPFPVYAGRDTAEAEAAMEASNALVFEIIRNPTTIRKRRKTALPYSEPHPVVETAEEAATIEEEPVVEDTAAPASPADVAPAGGVSGKRGRAA
jgi:hypothetical protein